MRHQPCWQPCIVMSVVLIVCLGQRSSTLAQDKPGIKSFDHVRQIFQSHFANLSGYATGDLLTTQDVKPLFDKLAQAGWPVQDRDQILNRVIPSGSFLGKTLRTPRGKKFYREISGQPGSMERVEEMSKMAHGQKSVQQLVYGPPMGADFFNAWSSTPGGGYLDRGLATSASGKKVRLKVRRIYTEDALLRVLQSSFMQFQASEKSSARQQSAAKKRSDLEKRSRQPRRIVVEFSD